MTLLRLVLLRGDDYPLHELEQLGHLELVRVLTHLLVAALQDGFGHTGLLLDHLGLEKLGSEFGDDIPSVVNVGILGILSTHAETDDVLAVDGRRHHVQLAGCVDVG